MVDTHSLYILIIMTHQKNPEEGRESNRYLDIMHVFIPSGFILFYVYNIGEHSCLCAVAGVYRSFSERTHANSCEKDPASAMLVHR